MVILRGCARCGGDVLTGDRRNVRCLQCGYRPEMPVAELRRRARGEGRQMVERPVDVEAIFAALESGGEREEGEAVDSGDNYDGDGGARCPRCDDDEPIALDKLRAEFNTCYRCRLCGHIFSPGSGAAELPEAS